MKKERKVKIVENLKEKLGKAKSWVLTDYRGLTHRQMEEIKRALKESGADFIVTKNTLLKLATGKKEEIDPFLTGPTAILFSYQDEIAPLGVLAKFIKNFGLPQVKVGIIGEKVLSSEEILRLAALPSREILMATLVTRLKSPIYGLHYSLNWNLQKLTLILKAVSVKTSAAEGGDSHG